MDIRQTLDKLGFADLNAMQKNVSDAFLHSDKDIIVLSPTGSGKTLAYLLPLPRLRNKPFNVSNLSFSELDTLYICTRSGT